MNQHLSLKVVGRALYCLVSTSYVAYIACVSLIYSQFGCSVSSEISVSLLPSVTVVLYVSVLHLICVIVYVSYLLYDDPMNHDMICGNDRTHVITILLLYLTENSTCSHRPQKQYGLNE